MCPRDLPSQPSTLHLLAYFDTIHNASTLQQKALSENAKKLSSIVKPEGSITRTASLPLLEPYLVNETPSQPDIQALIGGPVHDLQTLPMFGIGYVWGQLGALLQRQGDEDNQEQEEDTQDLQDAEVDDTEAEDTEAEDTEVEDTELLYIQLPDAQAVAETHAERVSASYRLQSGSNCILWAVDDGGVRLLSLPGLKDSRIVALMEAKQRFQDFEDGKPVISDGLLAQMAGQALLVLLDKKRRTIFDTR
ncbi:hypothetical protein F5144DRAFT_637880 [Chaetomium tenue]|uniref:Uncharacterized protein n=1 Tax=Chaetomium tenue TaxID=1854479 RepID=A0ACB7PT81_9PEZI|nr:hypothetical protein F5144DRAFT_637880 [Chaetomium globosum]